MGNSIAKARGKSSLKEKRVVHQRKPTVEHWLCEVCKKNRIRNYIDIYPGVGTGSKHKKVCCDCYEEYTTCDGCLQKFTYENTFNSRGYQYQDHWYCSKCYSQKICLGEGCMNYLMKENYCFFYGELCTECR